MRLPRLELLSSRLSLSIVERGGCMQSFPQLGEAQRVRLARDLDRKAHPGEFCALQLFPSPSSDGVGGVVVVVVVGSRRSRRSVKCKKRPQAPQADCRPSSSLLHVSGRQRDS